MYERSTVAQVLIAIIPIVGIVMGAVVVFFYLLWDYRKRTMLIKAGYYVAPRFNLLAFSLLSGLLLSSVGLMITVFLALIQGLSYGLLGGLIPLALGIGLLIYYRMRRVESRQ
jgi:hypothetical protein